MYERFTDLARKVMSLANEEAQRLRHEYIGTEHILLGLVKAGSGVAADVLNKLDIDLHTVSREVEKIIMPGPDVVGAGRKPQTPRAKRVIEFAIEEARNLGHDYVGTEHLLLGLLRESEGVAGQVLLNLGLGLEDLREEVLNLAGAKLETGIVDLLRRPPPPPPEPEFSITNLPDHAQKIAFEFDWQIKQLRRDKDTAGASFDFDKAKKLLEAERKLTEQRERFVREWSEK